MLSYHGVALLENEWEIWPSWSRCDLVSESVPWESSFYLVLMSEDLDVEL